MKVSDCTRQETVYWLPEPDGFYVDGLYTPFPLRPSPFERCEILASIPGDVLDEIGCKNLKILSRSPHWVL